MNESTSNVVPFVRPKDAATLTPKMHMVWIALCKYIDEHGYGPSISELCQMTALPSRSTIHSLLTGLEEREHIVRPRRSADSRCLPRCYEILVWPEGMEP